MVVSAGIASAGFALAVRAVDSGNGEAARRQLEANGGLLLAVLAPAALGMALTASSLATVLVGPEFRAAVTALTPWMAAGAFFAGFRAHYLDHAFQLGHRMAGQVWVTGSACVVTLGLDALLIPQFGPLGAAMAVTAGAALSAVHAAIAGRAAFSVPLPWATGWRVGAACVVMAASVLAIPGSGPCRFVRQDRSGRAVLAARRSRSTCWVCAGRSGRD